MCTARSQDSLSPSGDASRLVEMESGSNVQQKTWPRQQKVAGQLGEARLDMHHSTSVGLCCVPGSFDVATHSST